MNDYYKVDFHISPANPAVADLLADALADEGFESFEPSDSGDSMTAYAPAAVFRPGAVSAAAEACPIAAAIEWSAELVPGQDWNSEWEKHYFKPIVVAGRVAVHSSFHTDVPEAEYDIVIDPRMAFGTGHHATTTLMMKALLANPPAARTVVDMGTGTGILAILAVMLGAAKVTAIEIDPFAADNARDNVALNLSEDAARTLSVITGDAAMLAPLAGSADLMLANINRNIITADISQYAATLAPGGQLVTSGFYAADAPVVKAAAEAAGLSFVSSAEGDAGWCSITFEK